MLSLVHTSSKGVGAPVKFGAKIAGNPLVASQEFPVGFPHGYDVTICVSKVTPP